MNDRYKVLRIVPPVSKQLDFGDVGIGAMASVTEIASVVKQMLADLQPRK